VETLVSLGIADAAAGGRATGETTGAVAVFIAEHRAVVSTVGHEGAALFAGGDVGTVIIAVAPWRTDAVVAAHTAEP